MYLSILRRASRTLRHGGTGQVICLCLLFVGLISPSTGRATTATEMSLEEVASASDLVVRGSIVEIEVMPSGPDGREGIYTRATVEVHDALRGAPSSTLSVYIPGGRYGRFLRVVVGEPTFEVGQHLLLFLSRVGSVLTPTAMARGVWVVAIDGETVRRLDSGAAATQASLTQVREALARSGGDR